MTDRGSVIEAVVVSWKLDCRERGSGARALAWTALYVLIALVLDVSLYWRERATLPWGVHPLAVGHPPGSGLGPVGEGGAHHRLNDLRPRGQVC